MTTFPERPSTTSSSRARLTAGRLEVDQPGHQLGVRSRTRPGTWERGLLQAEDADVGLQPLSVTVTTLNGEEPLIPYGNNELQVT